jgi:stage II sporulation SpoAA-like protein
MGVTVEREEGSVRILRVAGMLKKAEFDAVLTAEAKQWEPQTRVKVLVLAEGFQGWERNEGWGDLSFFLKYGDQIDKIAIVGDPKWEDDLLMFAAAGFRRAPVKFFPTGQTASARGWLVG